MHGNNDFLGTEPIGKLLVKMAAPTIAAQLINMLYNIVDRIYIGHIPNYGSLALTGVGVCMPIILLVSAFAAFISMGGAPKASIYLGKGDKKSASYILGNSFVIQVIVSVALTAVLLIWNRPMLLSFGASENTIGYAVDYMNIYAIGTIFVQLTLGMNAFITGQGFAKHGMLTVAIGAICNIILDPLFIFTFDMGVRGAAWATIISQAISAVWAVSFLLGKHTVIKLDRRYMTFKKGLMLPCLFLGVAPFIMQASESVINVCFNSSLLKYGGDTAVGAMTILSSVMMFAMLPMQGLGQGAQPIISYNYGAGNAKRVKHTFKLLLICAMVFSTILWGAVQLFPELFASIFSPNDELIGFTAWAMRIYMAVALLFGIQIACQMTLIAIGHAKASIIVALVRKVILLIPLIYILPSFLSDKTFAVYLAEPVADAIAVTFTAILFFTQFRKILKGMESQQKA